MDGVSPTYGNKSNHIWTSAAASIPRNANTNCDRCDILKAPFVGDDYSCEVTFQCCSDTKVGNELWDRRTVCWRVNIFTGGCQSPPLMVSRCECAEIKKKMMKTFHLIL